MDRNCGQGADCQDCNVNDLVADGKIDGKQVFPVELAKLGAD
jgi:hypothetical protein